MVYTWRAVFSNDTELQQTDGKKETLFAAVEERKAELVKFYVEGNGETYYVDLNTNEIVYPGGKIVLKGTAPELIYKRRNAVRAEVGTGRILDARVTHILGLKTSVEEKQVEITPQIGVRAKDVKLTDTAKKSSVSIITV